MALLRFMLCLWVSVGLSSSLALAQSDGRDQALLLYERAEEHFRSGEFERSALLLREAIDLFDAAPMHFNLAKSLHEVGELETARDEYQRFLEMEAESDRRPEVEARIAQIEAEIVARDAQLAAAEEPTPPEPDPVVEVPAAEVMPEEIEDPPPSPSPAPWIVAATAALPLGAGIVSSVLFRGEVDDARNAADQRAADAHRESADRFGLMANIFYGIGGAVALTGIIWGIVSLNSGPDENLRTRLRLGPTGAAIEGIF